MVLLSLIRYMALFAFVALMGILHDICVDERMQDRIDDKRYPRLNKAMPRSRRQPPIFTAPRSVVSIHKRS